MINWLEWIGVIPFLGLTGNWRGYRMGGKAIGGANMSTDMKKKFEAARASGNMDQAKALADKAQEVKDKKKAEKAKAKEAKTIAADVAKPGESQLVSVDKIKPNLLSSAALEQKGFTNIGIKQGFKKKQEALEYLKNRNKNDGGNNDLIDPDKYQIRGSGSTWYVYSKMNKEIPYKEFRSLSPEDARSRTRASEMEIIKWKTKNGGNFIDPKKYTDKQKEELKALQSQVKRDERIQSLVSMNRNRPQDFDYLTN